MDNTCPICLNRIKESEKKVLSCNHRIHNKCYINIVKRENYFIKCPICREVNTDTDRDKSDIKKNIQLLLSNVNKNGTMKKCICKTKKGISCKNNAIIFNYGKCNIHSTNTLNEGDLVLMEKYIYLILSQRIGWLGKVFLFDSGKKLILKYKIKELDDLLVKYYEFFSVILKDGDIFVKNYNKFYEYYGIELPEKSWLKKCRDNYILY